MKKLLIVLFGISALIVGLIGTTTTAFAAHPDLGEDFVCPVIDNQAVGEHNPIAGELGSTGTYTVVPEKSQANNLNVPDKATNGDGLGKPGETSEPYAQSQPGDTDYTAIWNGDILG